MLLAATTRLGRSAARFRSTPTSSSLAPSSLTFSSEPERAARLADLPVTYGDIARAQLALKKHLPPTPCPHSHFLSELTGMNVYLKLELNQFTGSFKERGARNALITMEEGVEGVIAASAGNHALALSYHGAQMGVPVTVVMPTVAPLAKVDKCRKFGANIIIKGGNIGESKEYADEIAAAEGLKYINGYDDPPIVAGAGTIGIEIMDQVPEVDIVVVPVGGAGLIAGVSCAVKTLDPNVKVFGVEPEFAASYTKALKHGEPTFTEVTPTLADGLAVPTVGPHAFKVAKEYVDETFLCEEKDIAIACLRLIENEKMVAEGGGAIGLTAILPGGALDKPEYKGKTVVIPICGGNIDTTTLGRVIDRGLAADYRLVRFIATVSDRPGGIAKLTRLLADEGASVKDIYHERSWLHSSVSNVQMRCVVEMRGREHTEALMAALEREGYPVVFETMEQPAAGDIEGTARLSLIHI